MKSLAAAICKELELISTDSDTLPNLPEAPLAEGLGLTDWESLKK